MKTCFKGLITIFIAFLVIITACTPDVTPKTARYIIYGTTLSGQYSTFKSFRIDGDIVYSARPIEIDWMDEKPEETNSDLYLSLLGIPKLVSWASPIDAFAFDRIMERQSQLSEDFDQYILRLGRNNDTSASAGFVCAYIRGVPSITANKTLFGRPAGTDLSEWFLFNDRGIIEILGTDFKMVERAGKVHDYLSPSEYFIKDKMLPLTLHIRLKEIPEEVDVDKHAVMGENNNIVTISIRIPVMYECYWDWCKALYTNPNAEERIYDGDIKIDIYICGK